MKLIVGLGNPGDKYHLTRHNIGFMIVDEFINHEGLSFSKKFNSLVYKTQNYIIIKPQTYMNLSGQAVLQVMNFYKIDIENILIIHDDISFELGVIKTKPQGSSGGHNGIKSIIKELKTTTFWRTRLGVGTPIKEKLSTWVLGKFKSEELDIIKKQIPNCLEIIKLFIEDKNHEIMNRFN